MSMNDEHLEQLAKLKAIEGENEWYGWGSPIGLTIFLIGLVVCGILIRFIFLMK
jgi:hypothetical protein